MADVLPNWPTVKEDERPFGLGPGESTSWEELTVIRRAALGPNWQYIVLGRHRGFRVNVFNPAPGVHRMLIHGLGQGGIAALYIREDLEAPNPTEALKIALARASELDQPSCERA